MLFIVQFVDHPLRQALRQSQMAAHLLWLKTHEERVLQAGSLRERVDEPAKGGLWIVEAADKEAVLSLLKTDPFWIHGLRASVEVLHWSKAFEDRKVLI
ncbi:YciI family protein [Roseateles koreensis]|uniref:YciI family protein n=1 Tax=Roseateles koreensis TaxID=2987526 RepID=A0ABT5KR40_9BURK|nr:YciI family protein [Roseateles koreensis]MDC8785359.1 YciI family protein [Roseateles koreensis]